MAFLLALAATAGVAGLVLVAEFTLRLYLRRSGKSYVTFPPNSRVLIHLHPDFAPLLKDRVVRYEVNEHGERARSVAPGAGAFRVLVLGGSAAECRVLDQDDTWANQLQNMLSVPESLAALKVSGVHVGLIARSQLDVQGLEALVDELTPQFEKQDLIVLMTGISDITRWLEDGARSGTSLHRRPASHYFAHCRSTRYTLKRSALMHYLVRRALAATRVTTQFGVGECLTRELMDRQGVTSFTPLRSDPARVLDDFEDTLHRVLLKLSALSPRVIVVKQPWYEGAHATPEDRKHLWSGRIGRPDSAPAQFISDADLADLCRRLDERTDRVCRRAQVPAIDVKNALGGPLGKHYYDHFHFTPAGAAVVAKAVAEVVRSQAAEPKPEATYA